MIPDEEKIWYFITNNNERTGPLTISELAKLASEGTITPATLVWSPARPDWVPAEQITDLLKAQNRPTPPPTASLPRQKEALPPSELKPSKALFIFPKIIGHLITSSILAGLAAYGLYVAERPPALGLIAFGVFFLIGLASAFAAYRKELYRIGDSKLICQLGGLFSDETTELDIRNITHVKIKLPWLRFKLFNVGNVFVESAGTSKPIILHAIKNPESVFEEFKTRMRKNGYDLSQNQLLHEDRPAIVGILLEFAANIVGGLFLLSLFASGFAKMATETGFGSSVLPGPILITLLACLIIFAILRFLDFRRRTYRVYNDVVTYDEGFLTRQNAFIPYENIADSDVKRTLLDRILGIYDVCVSCQGSGSEIKFRRLRSGAQLSAAIDQILIQARQKPKLSRALKSDQDAPSQVISRREEPDEIPLGEPLITEMRIHGPRLMVPLLLIIPIFPLWIVLMIQALIRLTSTRYFVREGSLRQSYEFLSTEEREFTNDKITGLVIRRNLWDHMFNTMTLKFWSIGSGKSLEFSHIHRDLIDLPRLMAQINIPAPSETAHQAKISFGLFAWLSANIRAILAIAICALAIAAIAIIQEEPKYNWVIILPSLIFISHIIHAILYYPRQRLTFHAHHVEAEQGIFSKSRFHVRYKNIKRLLTTQYPGGTKGSLQIFVAGEEELIKTQKQNKHRKPAMRQCYFKTAFLEDSSSTQLLLDDILAGRAEPTPEATPAAPAKTFIESKRSVITALVKLILISTLLFPLLALLPLTIPLTIISISRWRYRIEETRVIASWGVFFKKETSILLDRVDSLRQNQGILNKIFKNGRVSIMSAGSSKPDLVLTDAKSYATLYEQIRRMTES